MSGRAPPGLRGAIIGRLNERAFAADMFGFLSDLAARFGDVSAFDLGRTPCILVNSAEHAAALFLRHERDLRKPDFLRRSNAGHWGDGLTTLEGEAWRARRRALAPLFRPRSLGPGLSVAARCAREMLDGWAGRECVDLGREIRLLQARIASRLVLDADVAGCGAAQGRSGLLSFGEAFGETFVVEPRTGEGPAPGMRRPRAARAMPQAVAIVDARLQGAAARGDALSAMLEMRLDDGSGFERGAVLGEVMQMLFAGHLTVPASLLGFWRLLAAAPACEAALAAEAEGLLGAAVSDVDPGQWRNALSRSLCMAAIREALRLEPPAPILYREVARSFTLGGFAFDRGCAVWVSPRLLHRDPRYFAEPERFAPERFMAEGGRAAAPDAYMPFGAGPRICIASRQALLQMTLVALTTAARCRLTPLDESGRFAVLWRTPVAQPSSRWTV